MNELMTGAITMAFAVATLFFLKFWKQTRDRLFAFFALAFFILTVNRVFIVLITEQHFNRDLLYWIRFTAFVIILVGILDKNRSRPDR